MTEEYKQTGNGTGDRTKMKKKNFVTGNNTFKGKTEKIRDHTFVYSDIKTNNKRWITSKEKFIDYAGSKYSIDEKLSLQNKKLTVVTTVEPAKPGTEADEYDKANYFQQRKTHDARMTTVRVNLTTLYTTLWEQCDEEMQNKMKVHPKYKDATATGDVIGLMSIVEDICEGGAITKFFPLQQAIARKRLVSCIQKDNMSLTKYKEQFDGMVAVAERAGIHMGDNTQMRSWFAAQDKERYYTEGVFKPKDLDAHLLKEIREGAKQQMLAIMFIDQANDNRFAEFKRDCHNSLVKGTGTYPKTLEDAHTAMTEYKPMRTGTGNRNNTQSGRNNGHTFTNSGQNEHTKANDSNETNKEEKKYQCYRCGRWNQCIARNCQHSNREDGTPIDKPVEDDKKKQTGSMSLIAAITEEETNNDSQAEDDKASWDDGIDHYQFSFNINGTVTKKKKMVIVEDLQGNNKHAFNQDEGKLNPFWILLDNCSTVHMFCNAKFLRNIRTVDRELHLFTNAGKAIIDQMGDLPGFGPVWYHAGGIANVLSFNGVANKEGYKVEYQSWKEDAFKVTNPQGATKMFRPSPRGLYFWDSEEVIKRNHTGTVLTNGGIETATKNEKKFSKQDVDRANRARQLQHVAGHLSVKELLAITSQNTLMNCPVTPRDVRIMEAIYGPSIPGTKGKTVRKNKTQVNEELTPVPEHVKEYYSKITISIDVMYVNTIPFLTTVSHHIHYVTATPLPGVKATIESILSSLKELDKFYIRRGFKIQQVLADGEFKPLEMELAKREIMLNVASRDEHVPAIERTHRVIKERARCYYNMTPFKRYPKRMTVELIMTVIYYLNGFPWGRGVSGQLSPMTIMTGRKLDYNLHCQIAFGTYAQVRRETTNTLRSRTEGAVAIRPNNNTQGGMLFYSLYSGRVLDRSANDYTIIPMPVEAIDRMNELGKGNMEGITIEDRNEDDSDDDEEFIPDDESDIELDDEIEPIEGEVLETDTDNASVDHSNDMENTGVGENVMNNGDDDMETTGVDTATGENNDDGNDLEERNTEEIPTEDVSDDDGNVEEEEPIEPVAFRTRGIRTRSHTRPMDDQFEYSYIQEGLFGSTGFGSRDKVKRIGTDNGEMEIAKRSIQSIESITKKEQTVNNYVLTQYSLKVGLRKFGEKGKAATNKELLQMLRHEVFEEILYESLSEEDKRNALPILLFLSMKRDGSIKGRACADGRRQRIWMQKEDSASPTIAIEAFFYTLVMDAFEIRYVATCDLPGHFLQTTMEGRVILRIEGDLALLLVELDPGRWRKHLKYSGKKPVIFVKCSKAIYGTINAALLSYKKLIGHLEEWGFKMNPYEPCCFNKTVNGSQLTVVFHVDDMKLSHKDPQVVEDLIKQLEGVYARLDPMTVSRGQVHQYLGMTIDFRKQGEVRVSMYDYVKKMIDELPDEMIGSKPTAAAEHLFKVDENGVLLDEKRKEVFHHLTAKTLYLSKRARPDLQLATGFLCTRVKNPDEHDWKKLGHLMKYLQATAFMPLILRSDGQGTSIYIDGAHAIHADMKGHAGVFVTEGRGAVYAASTKNKLNTTSSTETEIVSVGEKLPKHIWFRYFRVAQGGDDKEDILYQDNQSAMLMEKNGRMSCGKGSKHIHIRYFFITDKIKKKEIRVVYCPTEEMIADYLTKPLQGAIFRKFRDLLLGIREEEYEEYKKEYVSTLQEFGLVDDNTEA